MPGVSQVLIACQGGGRHATSASQRQVRNTWTCVPRNAACQGPDIRHILEWQAGRSQCRLYRL